MLQVEKLVLQQWIMLSGHLKMYAETKMIHSRMTLTQILRKATEITGHGYPRSRKGAKGAYLDIREKIQRARPIQKNER